MYDTFDEPWNLCGQSVGRYFPFANDFFSWDVDGLVKCRAVVVCLQLGPLAQNISVDGLFVYGTHVVPWIEIDR